MKPENLTIPYNGLCSAIYRSSWLKLINLNHYNFYRYKDCFFFNDDYIRSNPTLYVHTRGGIDTAIDDDDQDDFS